MNVVPIHSNEVIVKRDRLAELERIKRAHDAYMAATEKMRVRQVEVLDKQFDARGNGASGKAEWCSGWLACLREFAEEVVRA